MIFSALPSNYNDDDIPGAINWYLDNPEDVDIIE